MSMGVFVLRCPYVTPYAHACVYHITLCTIMFMYAAWLCNIQKHVTYICKNMQVYILYEHKGHCDHI